MNPAIIMRAVVLPDPLGPRRVTNSPDSTCRFALLRASTSLYVLVRFLSVTLAPLFPISIASIGNLRTVFVKLQNYEQ
jgi:hypothetical protein